MSGTAGRIPVYYPYYPTYGYAAWYSPWSGAYQRGAVAYGPYGGVGAAARYNPRDRHLCPWRDGVGTLRRHRRRPGLQPAHRDLCADASGVGRLRQLGNELRATRRRLGAQRSRDQQGDGRDSRRSCAPTTAPTVGRSGPNGSGFVAAGEEGVYAGRDGSVYRRADGGWQKYEDGAWGSTQTPARDGAATAREKATSAGGTLSNASRSEVTMRNSMSPPR